MHFKSRFETHHPQRSHLLGLHKQMKPGFVVNIGLKSVAGVFTTVTASSSYMCACVFHICNRKPQTSFYAGKSYV